MNDPGPDGPAPDDSAPEPQYGPASAYPRRAQTVLRQPTLVRAAALRKAALHRARSPPRHRSTRPETVHSCRRHCGVDVEPAGWNIAGSVLLFIAVDRGHHRRVGRSSLPYYSLEPGSVYDTIERVEAPGDLVFVPQGEIGFVTVAQTANITPWQWLDAKLDNNVRIRHEDEGRGDQTADELRGRSSAACRFRRMSGRCRTQQLGFDLVITPIGIEVAQVFDCTAADGTLGTGDLIVGVNGIEVLRASHLSSSSWASQLAMKSTCWSNESIRTIQPNRCAPTWWPHPRFGRRCMPARRCASRGSSPIHRHRHLANVRRRVPDRHRCPHRQSQRSFGRTCVHSGHHGCAQRR